MGKQLARILLASLLLVAMPCLAQTYPATDSFSGGSSTSPVALSSKWTNNQNDPTDYSSTIVQAGGLATLSTNTIGMATYTGETFNNDQYAQVVVHGGKSGDNDPYGPCVRTDTNGNGYCYFPNGANGQIYILKGGSAVSQTNGIPGGAVLIHYQHCPYIGGLGSQAASDGDTFQISAHGATITCTDVTTSTSDSATDSTFSTGSPGMFINQSYAGLTTYELGAFQADCIPTCNTSATNPAATPSFNPPAGSYTSAQQVTISSTTAGATIYYTTDSSTPVFPIAGTTQQYSSAISVSASRCHAPPASPPARLEWRRTPSRFLLRQLPPSAPLPEPTLRRRRYPLAPPRRTRLFITQRAECPQQPDLPYIPPPLRSQMGKRLKRLQQPPVFCPAPPQRRLTLTLSALPPSHLSQEFTRRHNR